MSSQLIKNAVIYFFFPETARLTLEEIAQNFGEEVAVHLTNATDEEKAQLDNQLVDSSANVESSVSSDSAEHRGNDTEPSPIDGEHNVTKAE
jgi:(p)ppGpp synthase/HD superfamily hydrolase